MTTNTPITDPQVGKKFLHQFLADEISSTESDTFRRKVFEIEIGGLTEVWIERESKLEEPEYFYQLFQYQGEEDHA